MPKKIDVTKSPKFTRAAKDAYLRQLRLTGNKGEACKAANMSREGIRLHLLSSEEFTAEHEEAMEDFRETLEREVLRRAVEGVEEFVVFKGQLCMVPSQFDIDGNPLPEEDTGEIRMVPLTKKVYSDRLMELLAKRHIAAYTPGQSINLNVNSGVLKTSKPLSIEEWEKDFAEQAIEGTVVETQ